MNAMGLLIMVYMAVGKCQCHTFLAELPATVNAPPGTREGTRIRLVAGARHPGPAASPDRERQHFHVSGNRGTDADGDGRAVEPTVPATGRGRVTRRLRGRARYSMSRRSGPGSPIKDMRNKGIYSASRVEAPQQVVHYDREAL
jgi:hypothetical protein